MQIDYTVSYYDIEGHPGVEYKHPVITLKFKEIGVKWTLSDIGYDSDLQSFRNIRECLLTNDYSKGFGGGGNSSWNCYVRKEVFVIEFDISGLGGDSTLRVKIPNKDMVGSINTIIEVLECAAKNERYIPSVLC